MDCLNGELYNDATSGPIEEGDRVEYVYTHYLNRKSSTEIVKHGTVLKLHKNDTKALVKFDKNKNPCWKRLRVLTLLNNK